MLISDNIGFTEKTACREKEEYFLIIKVSLNQEDVTVVNIYGHNTRASKYMGQYMTEF